MSAKSTWAPKPVYQSERIPERLAMVREQLEHPIDTRPPIRSDEVLAAFRVAPRHRFVPSGLQSRAYEDCALPIPEGQTISQPYMVATMLEALQVSPDDTVLDVGTGSGYQAALLRHLSPKIASVEVVPSLFDAAKTRLLQEGYGDIVVRRADANLGWPREGNEPSASFSRIIIACAAPSVPDSLWSQLETGGNLVVPLNETQAASASTPKQGVYLIKKAPDGSKIKKRISGALFVPFVRT